MTVTDKFDELLDLLDAAEAPDAHQLAEILKGLISNIGVSHALLAQKIHHLEERVDALEKPK